MTSFIGPLRIVEETQPSKIVVTSGVVELDRVNVKSMFAGDYSTVVQVHVQPETFVQEGSVIATLACPAAMEWQAFYIWQLQHKKRRDKIICMSEVKNPDLALLNIGFTEHELKLIRRTRRPLESWEVRTQWSGFIVDLPQPADEIAQNEPVFSISWRKVIRTTVDALDAPAVGASAKFGVDGNVFNAMVAGVKKRGEMADVEIEVLDWRDDIPMGVPVRIKFRVRKPPSRHLEMVGMPKLDLSDWGYTSMPRGQALCRLLHDQNRHDDAAKFSAFPKRASSLPVKTVSSMPARPSLPPPAAESQGGIRRTAILMSADARERFGIQHHEVSETLFTPSAYFTARVKTIGLSAEPITLTAPIQGKVTWLSGVTDRALPTGEPFCTIESEQVKAAHRRIQRAIAGQRTSEAQRARRVLTRLGMTAQDVSDLEKGLHPEGVLSLRTPVPCRIASLDVPTGQAITTGAALAQAHPLQWTALCLDLDDASWVDFGSVVDLNIIDPGTGRLSSSAISALSLIDVSRKKGRVHCRIEFPEPPAALQRHKELQVFMAAPARRRSVIAVPEDCVTTICRTSEVLIDNGITLTPQTVRVGRRYDGLVEILHGLAAGHRVVRNLDALAMRSRRLSAVLLGLWHYSSLVWEFGLDE